MYLIVARQLIVMALIVVVSLLFSKKNGFGEKESQYLSRLLVYVINPCMIVSTFDLEFDEQRFHELLIAIVISFILHLAMIFVSMIFIRRKDGNKSIEEIERLGVVFTNSGFIGIPLINGVFGSRGVFYLMAYIFVFNILQWTWGEAMLSGKFSLKKIFTNPNVLACLFGLGVFMMPGKLPFVIGEPFKMIGACNGAISMTLLGVLFATFKGLDKGYVKPLLKVLAVRLIVCGALTLWIIIRVLNILGFWENYQLMTGVLFIATLCPIGMTVSSFAVIFERDTKYASLMVSISSALCILTIPLWVLLFQHFTGAFR